MQCFAMNLTTVRAPGHNALSMSRIQALETTCEAISYKMHLKGISKAFCSHCESCCGFGDKIHSCPRPSASKKNWLDFSLKFCHFQKWKYSSNIMDHLSIISPMSLWPIYQVSTRLYTKMLFLQHFSFTMLTEVKTCLHCTSPQSQWSQSATCSSDTQHQKIQPHTLQGCHCDITLAYRHTGSLSLVQPSNILKIPNVGRFAAVSELHKLHHFYRYSSIMCSYCDKNISEILNQFLNTV
jgi:hypothetical protein